MKKGLTALLLIILIILSGCQRASDTFLAYKDSESALVQSMDNRITEADFFADDIAVITEAQNTGGDNQLTAGAELLVNITDNQTVYADHVFDKMYPASLTKLLTALVVLQYGELTDSVKVTADAAQIAGNGARVCGYEEGDTMTLETLLNSLLVYSGNDAAIAIANHIGGSEEAFVELMNKEADKIGAVKSNFVNSHGLHDDNQFTTAYDMYLIFNALIKYDTFRSIISTDTYTAVYTDKDGNEKQKTLDSTNSYLSGEENTDTGLQVIGGLSGTTSKAGSCLILLCKDSNSKEYIAIIFNASDNDSMYSQMSRLLSYTISE